MGCFYFSKELKKAPENSDASIEGIEKQLSFSLNNLQIGKKLVHYFSVR